MADAYKIVVHKRDEMGSRDVKNLRKEGKIPGVYYSSDSKSSIPFYMIDADLTGGGHLTQSLNDIEIKCLPTKIPEFIEVDVSEIGISESLYVRDITPPEDVELTTQEDIVIVSITHGISDSDLETEVVEDEEFTFDDTDDEKSDDEESSSDKE